MTTPSAPKPRELPKEFHCLWDHELEEITYGHRLACSDGLIDLHLVHKFALTALQKENEELKASLELALNRITVTMGYWHESITEIKSLEAKLAIAVEALEKWTIVNHIPNTAFSFGGGGLDTCWVNHPIAEEALSKIKGVVG